MLKNIYYMSKYLLLIKVNDQLSSDIIEYYKNYKTKYEGDSGIDLVCPCCIECNPFKTSTINFNIQCEMINNETGENVSYYLYPRSSISSTPLILANSVGIIDSNYRGNIMAKVKYIPNEYQLIDNYLKINSLKYEIYKGTKLFQICSPDLSPIEVKVVVDDELSKTIRGSAGFGSSGTII